MQGTGRRSARAERRRPVTGRTRKKRASFREAQEAFDSYMRKMLRNRAFRRELAAIAERRAALGKDNEDGVYLALEEAARPLADFLEAACGGFAYQMADAAGSILLKRTKPLYRKVMGKPPASRAVAPALHKTELFARLQEATAKLGPVAGSIQRREDECMAELRKLLLPGWQAIARRMPEALEEWLGDEFDEDWRLGMAFDWWMEQRSKGGRKPGSRK